jgi:hypothetical protein
MKLIKVGLGVVVFILLSACQGQAIAIPTATAAMATRAQPAPTATAASSPTPSVTVVPTNMPTLESQVLQNIVFSPCIEISQSIPQNMKLPWNLLFTQDTSFYIFTPENDSKVHVPNLEGINQDIRDYYVSPDGKWLAYQDFASSKMFVEPADTLVTNQNKDRIIWKNGQRFWLRRWVDDHTVLLIYWKSETAPFSSSLFLNPFTGEKQEFLLEDLPNFKTFKTGGALIPTFYSRDGELVPDPTMKKVVYPENWDEASYSTLFDLESKRPLTRLKYYVNMFNDPLWSQDGNDFIIESSKGQGMEWFLVTRDGAVRQITRFSDFLPPRYSYTFYKTSRSGDGRYFVFQIIFEKPDRTTKYILLDLKSKTLDGYCIKSFPVGRRQSLVWSPDSKYLILSNDDGTDSTGDLILVDAENKKAYQILKEAVRVVGWVVKP